MTNHCPGHAEPPLDPREPYVTMRCAECSRTEEPEDWNFRFECWQCAAALCSPACFVSHVRDGRHPSITCAADGCGKDYDGRAADITLLCPDCRADLVRELREGGSR